MTAPQASDDFGGNLVDSIFEMFVLPEIDRRGLALERHEIEKVVVELNPDRAHPLVWINEAARIRAHVRVNRDLAEGEEVTASDVDEVFAVEPELVGPNSGYVCFATMLGRQFIRFDFRYNKQRVGLLLTRAREFLATALECLGTRPEVACDLAFSAAELSVQAQMLIQQERTKNHWQRQEWLDSWARHQNAPQDHADALRELRGHRLTGRYGNASVSVDPDTLGQLFAIVGSMIDSAGVVAAEPATRISGLSADTDQ
jgi:HEPN domain-containing protein